MTGEGTQENERGNVRQSWGQHGAQRACSNVGSCHTCACEQKLQRGNADCTATTALCKVTADQYALGSITLEFHSGSNRRLAKKRRHAAADAVGRQQIFVRLLTGSTAEFRFRTEQEGRPVRREAVFSSPSHFTCGAPCLQGQHRRACGWAGERFAGQVLSPGLYREQGCGTTQVVREQVVRGHAAHLGKGGNRNQPG